MRVHLIYVDGELNWATMYAWMYNGKYSWYDLFKNEDYYQSEINAKFGCTNNLLHFKKSLKFAKEKGFNLIVVTNQPLLLNAKECWNGESFDIYFYKNREIVPIQDLLQPQLKESNNILKMYLNGAFDKKEE